MAERLPPLTALRTFETAARHLNFSKAAEELHVTPTAVSHQIKSLEDYLGVQLFHRLNRGLALTEAGQAGLPKLQEGFACLLDAVREIENYGKQNALTVWSPPSFAAKWLVPRLQHFATEYPDIDLRVSASDTQIDTQGLTPGAVLDELRREGVDIAIRFGYGDYQGCLTEKLFAVEVVPLCSPRLLAGEPPLRSPADLRHHTLIHDDTAYAGRPNWPDWLDAAGVEGVDATRGVHFNHVSLALEAAIDGQGVVLSLKPLAADDLAAGRLVIPFDLSLAVTLAYYVVCPEETANQIEIATFRRWLLSEASACG